MANTKIKIKQSSVSGNIPTASQLDQGELALNTADKVLFSKDSMGAVFEIGSSSASSASSASGGLDNMDGGMAVSVFGGGDITFDGGLA